MIFSGFQESAHPALSIAGAVVINDMSSGIFRMVLVGLGAFLAALGTYGLLRSERLSKTGATANGVITRLKWDGGNGTGWTNGVDGRWVRGTDGAYFPEFSFQSADGVKHVVMSHCGSEPSPYTVGQTIRVLYDPADPSIAEIDSFRQLWLSPGILGVIGLVMLSIGIGLYLAPYFQN